MPTFKHRRKRGRRSQRIDQARAVKLLHMERYNEIMDRLDSLDAESYHRFQVDVEGMQLEDLEIESSPPADDIAAEIRFEHLAVVEETRALDWIYP